MKIGIYGGTFDPPHMGHVNILKCFLQRFNFDKVFVIPVYMPPHKLQKSSVSPQDRLEMSRLAFQSLSDTVIVSDMEISRQGRSYTADTIHALKEQGYDDIYFLCGTDMLLTMDTWYKPEYIFENATIVYANRETDGEILLKVEQKRQEYTNIYNAEIEFLSVNVVEISSTEIRKSLHETSEKFLPEPVVDYILAHNLYEGE